MATDGRRGLGYHGVIYPLRVIKQVATIFLATTGPPFHKRHPYLQRFVLDAEMKGLPPQYKFFAFWFGRGSLRQTGITGVAILRTGSVNVVSESVHPPFGYVLSLSGELRDRRSELISDFANYELDEATTLSRRLPVLETHWAMTGDYRTRDEIERDALKNDLRAAGVLDADRVIDNLQG